MRLQSEIALEVAIIAHYGQYRRDGITPYIEHTKAVMSRCKTDDEKNEILRRLFGRCKEKSTCKNSKNC